MQTLPLGRKGPRTSRLGYGCMRMVGDGSRDAAAAGITACRTAHELGYTLFDHADIYGGGACESLFGDMLRESPGLRDDILVTSKCGIRLQDQPTAGSPQRYDFSRDYIIASCEGSLSRLGTGHLDLLRLHRPDFLCNPTEVAEAFDALHRSGKVRYFGVSNFSPSQVLALQSACSHPLVVNQVEVNIGNISTLTDGTLDQCIALGMTPEAWCPVAGVAYPSRESRFDEAARQRVGSE